MTNTNRTLAELRTAITEDMKLNPSPGLDQEGERRPVSLTALLDLSDMQLFEKEVSLAHVDGEVALPDDFMSLIYVKRSDGVLLKSMPSGVPRLEARAL